MSLMTRRRMMGGAQKSGSGRLYIFKDGAYGDWLNGESFVGVNDNFTTAATVYAYSISSAIDDGVLILSAKTSNNRTSYLNFGIAIPQHSMNYKTLGYTVHSKNVSRWPSLYAGMSETLIDNKSGNSNRFVGLGENDMVRVDLDGTEVVNVELATASQRYVVISFNIYNTPSQFVKLSEIWIE